MSNLRLFIKKSIEQQFVKKIIGSIIKCTPNLREWLTQGLSVFTFHEVSDDPSSFAKQYGLAVSRKTFTQQVRWIKSNFEIIHPEDILNKKNIPKRAAIISFDDGFLGSFENGLPILADMQVPSVFFLNMQAIIEQKPILSAIACYLVRYVPQFAEFSKSIGLTQPAHLTLTPLVLKSFEEQYGPLDYKAIINYQGQFSNLETVKRWENKEVVVFGNHLFDHWNVAALSIAELKEQYQKSESALSLLKNKINVFAFTNGQPNLCFSNRDVYLLKQWGAQKAFFSSGGFNSNPSKFLLNRLCLAETDRDDIDAWYRMGRIALNGLYRKFECSVF